MANPATLLYNNLVQWNPPNVSTQTAPKVYRQLASNRDHVLRMHEIALGYIAQIRELLDTLEQTTNINVEEFRRELPNWTAMVLSYDNGWSQARQFDRTSLRFLSTLAPLLDGLVPQFNDDDIAEVGRGVEELLDILSKEKTIGRDLAIYLLNLINHIKWVLQDVKIQGDFQLARALTLLRDSIRTADEVSTDEHLKPRYKKLLRIFKRKDVVTSALEMGTAAAKAITAVQQALPPAAGG